MMSCTMILTGQWCVITVMNVHKSTDDSSGAKDTVYVFNQFAK
jgi:hypothetical protein